MLYFKLLFHFFLFISQLYQIIVWVNVLVQARLIEMIAETTVAVIGETVQLKCRTSLSTRIYWGYQPPGYKARLSVYEAGHLADKFRERYSVNITSDSYYNLIIRNVSFLDAANYTCIDNDDSPGTENQKASGELVVIS